MGSATPATRFFVTSVKLTPDEHRMLKEIAAFERRSLSNELRFLVERRAEELFGGDRREDAA